MDWVPHLNKLNLHCLWCLTVYPSKRILVVGEENKSVQVRLLTLEGTLPLTMGLLICFVGFRNFILVSYSKRGKLH